MKEVTIKFLLAILMSASFVTAGAAAMKIERINSVVIPSIGFAAQEQVSSNATSMPEQSASIVTVGATSSNTNLDTNASPSASAPILAPTSSDAQVQPMQTSTHYSVKRANGGDDGFEGGRGPREDD